MQTIQLDLSPELKTDIEYIKSVVTELQRGFNPKEEIEYMTRNEVAKFLHCNISTVHNLSVKKLLIKYQIGGKVLYRKDQVLNAIVKLKR